jgi:hypothetical protein
LPPRKKREKILEKEENIGKTHHFFSKFKIRWLKPIRKGQQKFLTINK